MLQAPVKYQKGSVLHCTNQSVN